MFKLFRIFTLFVTASLLATGLSLAGPGDKTDGDPEIPLITNPSGGKHPVEVLGKGGTANQTPAKPVVAEAQDRWLTVLKAYLRLIRATAS